MTRLRLFLVTTAVLLLALSSVAQEPPRLVVQITIDQLRGDLPLRYRDRLSPRGFRYLMEKGAWYTSAHHPHAHTETIVGHTTLVTGTYPSRHGMVANKWYDRDSGKFVNNIDDPNYPLLTIKEGDRTTPGISPRTILTTTITDELMLTTAGRAKVFGVSAKDRGAVSLAGHVGKALWYSDRNGCFITSTFYYPKYPDWVQSWCTTRGGADVYKNQKWELLRPREQYLYRDTTNVYPPGTPAERNMALLQDTYGFGRTFPHSLGEGRALYQNLTLTPQLDAMTLEFAKELIRQEKLGADADPDYLGISLNATDFIAHWFSHASLEGEDNLLRLDLALQDLFAFLDQQVGLSRTLIVLSADHGGPDYPETLRALKILDNDKGRLSSTEVQNAASQALTARYPSINGILSQYATPYVYLDRAVIEANKLDPTEVELVVAAAIMKLDGIAVAVPSTAPWTAPMDGEMLAKIHRNNNPSRSGDVYVVQDAQWQIDDPPPSDTAPINLQHGTPWTYDSYVPVAFVGTGVKVGMVYREIATVDVAATLAAYLRTRFPSGNVGVPLPEIVSR